LPFHHQKHSEKAFEKPGQKLAFQFLLPFHRSSQDTIDFRESAQPSAICDKDICATSELKRLMGSIMSARPPRSRLYMYTWKLELAASNNILPFCISAFLAVSYPHMSGNHKLSENVISHKQNDKEPQPLSRIVQ
jgi:hypothetical protein